MDDSCAVCAESLEWVAYGSCGHKDVCSTCVARLRFICNDRRCCICKTESPIIFVTKALGDYTKTINDFTVFPAEDKEGRSGQYWYHEDMQSYFDDLDEKVEENPGNKSALTGESLPVTWNVYGELSLADSTCKQDEFIVVIGTRVTLFGKHTTS